MSYFLKKLLGPWVDELHYLIEVAAPGPKPQSHETRGVWERAGPVNVLERGASGPVTEG